MGANSIELSLGVEELATTLAVSGNVDIAKGLLFNTLGSVSDEIIAARFMAANHSMLARGLFQVSGEKIVANPDLEKLLAAMLDCQVTIRAGKTARTGEDTLSYYQHDGIWLAHKIEMDVVHRFRYPVEFEEILDGLRNYFNPTCSNNAESAHLDLPGTLLTDLNSYGRRSFETMIDYIHSVSPGNPWAECLAEDFAEGPWRGSLLWVARKDAETVEMKGLLWVQGVERLWKIQSSPAQSEEKLVAQLCSPDDFNQIIQGFIHK